MRNFYLTLLLTPLIIGCSNGEDYEKQEQQKEYSYGDFNELKTEWNNLFSPAKTTYFVYIYGSFCGHCERIKQDVLSFVDRNRDFFYLVEYSEEIPISVDVTNTIGSDSVEEVSILGTPTLLEVMDSKLIMNIAGEKTITTYLDTLSHIK